MQLLPTPSLPFKKSLFRRSKRVLLLVASPVGLVTMAEASSPHVLRLYHGSPLTGAPVPPVSLVLGAAEANVLCDRGGAYTLASASEVHGTF